MPAEYAIGASETALSEQLAQGPLGAADAVRYASAIANRIRELHDNGEVAGDLTPERLCFSGMRVILAPGETPGGPWAAPERASGAACDPLTDIYSFGAILYHLLTGNAPGNHDISAFRRDLMRAEQAATAEANGDGPATLKLCSGLRRLALHCLDGDPERRCQRMQTVVMELKLLSLTVRQADPELTARRDRAEAALRAEVAALRAAVLPRVDAIECRLAELDRGVEELRAEVAVASSEKNRLRCDVESQASTIASLNSALCQTDDMVERVVEALDGLQTLFLERSVQRAVGNS